jgi:XTP/dITP diphosphohydrolase
MRMVLASNNAKKLRELQGLLALPGLVLLSQGELGVSEAEEPHRTFLENALAKARHAAAATGLPALADDSGLCVTALGGQPGVQSAVYAGEASTGGGGISSGDREARRARQDAANNALLLEHLAPHRAAGPVAARFVCTLVAVRHAEDPEPLVASGRWEGQILVQPDGDGGFGYDPLFWVPAFGATAAALAPEVKNAHSHRAQAVAALRPLLVGAWGLNPG